MEKEEKQVLLKDLCARLPYGLKVQFYLPNYQTNSFDEKIGEVFEIGDIFTHVHCDGIDYLPNTSRVKPYLRPMSSMTDDEQNEFDYLRFRHDEEGWLDFVLSKHLDWRSLIEKGLALEAPEGMYE